jgi:ribose/xylose/arabinose/galactoside ABC-type transport system permease subunit
MMARWRPTGRLQEAGLVVVILLLGVVLTLLADPVTLADGREVNNFLRVDNLVSNVATQMSWIAIMALGVTFVIAAGGIDISVGSISGLAALGAAAALQMLPEDASAWTALPIGVGVPLAIGAACGLVNGALVVGLRMHPFIVTLGTLSIFRGIALIAVPTKSLPSGDHTLPLAFTTNFLAWEVDADTAARLGLPPVLQPVPMLLMLLCGVAAWLFLSHTVGGRQVYAVGGNEEAARFSGIPVGRVKLRVYVLCGLMCGVAGMISAGYYGSANTGTNEGYELQVIAAAVVGGASLTGGRGTALGALLGALVIKLIENGIFIVRKIDLSGVLFFLPERWQVLTVSKEYSKIIIGIAIVLAVAVDRLSEHLQSRRLARARVDKS